MVPQSPDKQSESEYDLARDFFYRGQPRVALDHARKAVALNEDNAKALYFASTLHLFFCSGERGLESPDCRLPDAETYARRALRADGQFRDARNLLAQIFILEKKYKEAISLLKPLVSDPAYSANYLAWGNLGWAQVLIGSLDEGITSLKNAVTQPQFCVGFYRLGLAYEQKADYLSADTNLSQALEVDSKDCTELQDAWEARGRIRMKLHKIPEASSDWERCRQIAPAVPAGRRCAEALNSISVHERPSRD